MVGDRLEALVAGGGAGGLGREERPGHERGERGQPPRRRG
jgi:hypothetical protein